MGSSVYHSAGYGTIARVWDKKGVCGLFVRASSKLVASAPMFFIRTSCARNVPQRASSLQWGRDSLRLAAST